MTFVRHCLALPVITCCAFTCWTCCTSAAQQVFQHTCSAGQVFNTVGPPQTCTNRPPERPRDLVLTRTRCFCFLIHGEDIKLLVPPPRENKRASFVCSERCCSRAGRVPPDPPAELGRVLGGGDRGPLLWRRAGGWLHAWRRSHQGLSSAGGEPAEERDRVLPRWRMGPRQCTWVPLQRHLQATHKNITMETTRFVLIGMRSYDLLCRKMAKDLDSVVMSVE